MGQQMESSSLIQPAFIQPGTLVSVKADTVTEPTRIDLFLHNYFSSYSRSFFKTLIEDRAITLNGKSATKPSLIIKEGDIVDIQFPVARTITPRVELEDTNLGVKILFEHEHFLIVSKPAGLIIHPPSSRSKVITLVDWLVTHFSELSQVGSSDRPGIVHRLDKDTSGIVLVARNNYAHAIFGTMFKDRTIKKTYLALVQGNPPMTGSIDFRIDRHPTDPIKMTHLSGSGRDALTHYSVLENFNESALLEIKPETGRTHQIRVHCTAIGHPVLGDAVYGYSSKLIGRQALHASRLEFSFLGQDYSFTAPLPQDMNKLIDFFKKQNSLKR